MKKDIFLSTIKFAVRWSLVFAFILCVVFCNGFSISVPNLNNLIQEYGSAASIPFDESWNYQAIRMVKQIIHQFPIYDLSQGVFSAFTNSAYIVTVSGVLWSGLIALSFYPRGWNLRADNLRDHLGVSFAIGSMSLFQLSASIKIAYNPIESDSLAYYSKQTIGCALFALVIVVLFTRMRHRIILNYTSWNKEFKFIAPIGVGYLLIILEFIILAFFSQSAPQIEIPIIRRWIFPAELIINFLLLLCCVISYYLQKNEFKKMNKDNIMAAEDEQVNMVV